MPDCVVSFENMFATLVLADGAFAPSEFQNLASQGMTSVTMRWDLMWSGDGVAFHTMWMNSPAS